MRQLMRLNGETKMCKYTVRLSERADSKPLARIMQRWLADVAQIADLA
jgi:hypothetical protein